MAFTTRPEVLAMLGGAMKLVTKTIFMEKKLASNSVALPIPDILKQVMAQSAGGDPNLGAMFQNPIAAISSQLNGAASAAATAVTGALGTNAFSTALGGLQTVVNDLVGHAASLSGVAGGAGFAGMVAHANISQMLGSALPTEYGLDKVVQPLLHGEALGAIQSSVDTLAAQVLATPATVTAAAAAIDSHAASITATHLASIDALDGLQGVMETVLAVNTAVATVVGARSQVSGNPLLASVMQSVITPSMLDQIDSIEATLFPPLPAFPEPIQPLED